MSSPSARRMSRADPKAPVVPQAANDQARPPFLPANDLETPDPPNSDWVTSYCAGNRWRTRQLMMAVDCDPTGLAEAALNRERELQGLPPYRSGRSGRQPWPRVVLALLALALVVAALVAREIAPAGHAPAPSAVRTPAADAHEPHHAEQSPMFDGFLPLPADLP